MTAATPAIPPTIAWAGDRIRMIDQRRLPGELVLLEAATVTELCDAIATLAVRGAPALGAAGAMGVALAAVRGEDVMAAAVQICASRPTAVNLAWGVAQAAGASDPVAEAERIAVEDVARNRAMGAHGAAVLPAGARVLTHCNTGALAAVGWGTALGVVRSAWEGGNALSVWVDETRPLLQGARLTMWELGALGIPATLVVDGMAASLMSNGEVDVVIVGADRIAANGDVANKIGTYGLAVLAQYHGLPFYVAAPSSTFDPATATGADIRVEERDPEEVTTLHCVRIAPPGATALNRAFDVTPAALVTHWITETGVHNDPSALAPSP